MSKFTDFAKKRAEKAGKKYIRPDGQNEGMFRDNPVDVLEELADAWNITWLWLEHYVKEYGNEANANTAAKLFGLIAAIEWFGKEVETEAEKCIRLVDERAVRDVPWPGRGNTQPVCQESACRYYETVIDMCSDGVKRSCHFCCHIEAPNKFRHPLIVVPVQEIIDRKCIGEFTPLDEPSEPEDSYPGPNRPLAPLRQWGCEASESIYYDTGKHVWMLRTPSGPNHETRYGYHSVELGPLVEYRVP